MKSTQLLSVLELLKSFGSFARHLRSDSGGWYLTEIGLLNKKVSLARGLPAIGQLVKEVEQNSALHTVYEQVSLTQTAYIELTQKVYKIDSYIDAISSLLTSSSISEIEENEVYIKLPSSNNLAIVAESLSRLDKVLNQAMSTLIDAPSITVKRWENGSLWVDILVGSVSGVILIGGLLWSAACAFRKYQEGLILEKVTESLGIKNDMLKELKNSVAKAVNDTIEAEAKRLDEKHSKGKGDVETINRLQFCIREFYEMIRTGTEIHPSLLAPEDVKNVFPNMSEVLNLPSTQKLLTASSNESEDSAEAA